LLICSFETLASFLIGCPCCLVFKDQGITL